MIDAILSLAIKHRHFTVLAFLLIATASVFAIRTAHIDAIPDISENQQIVFSEWPGRSAQDVELQVTYPLSVKLQGIAGVKSIRGSSAFGISMIYLIFEEDVDFYWSRSRIIEKLSSLVGELPAGVSPQLGPDASGLGQVYWYTIENKPDALHPKSLAELRSLQDFYAKFLLQSVPGVSEVASLGGFVKEYQIDTDPKKLFAFDIGFHELVNAIQQSNLDVGAEVIEDGDREYVIRGKGFFKSLADIENVVVAVKNNIPVRVKEVADVSIGPAYRRGLLDKNGGEAVGGIVTIRYGVNPQEVVTAVKEKVEELRLGLPQGVDLVPFYDRTELISRTVNTVYSAIGQQIAITVVVILLFLWHWQSSVLVSLVLPFGIGISFIFMRLFDVDSNIMSLSGLVIAIGSMVDFGIIMTETIYAKLADFRAAQGAHHRLLLTERIQLVKEAAQEVGRPIVSAALTTIVTFVPIFALTDAEGKLFKPLAAANTFAMIGAVLVGLLLVPALACTLLRGNMKPVKKQWLSAALLRVYRPMCAWVLQHRGLFLLFPLLIILGGLWTWNQLGKEFMPSLNEGEIMYMPVTSPDVSLSKAKELLAYTDQVLTKHPLVAGAIGKAGRAETALDPAPISMFETLVKLKPQSEWPTGTNIYDIIEELDASLQVPGLVNSWDFPIQTRISMISTGIKTQVGIKIFGQDLEELEKLARQVGQVLEEVPGAYGIYAERQSGKPYIEFTVDRLAASRYGINVQSVNDILQTAVGGNAIGTFIDGRQRFAIRVRYKKDLRDKIEELKRVLVPSPLGHHVALEQLAEVRIVTGPAMIQSEDGMLRTVVLLNVKDRDLGSFVEEAKAKVQEKVPLPQGYTLRFAGQYENQIRSQQSMMILVPVCLLLILGVIWWDLRSASQTFLVFTSIPIAFAGGLLFLWIGEFNTSVAVWVGFITLFGIAVDDGVLMMTFLRQAIKKAQPTTLAGINDCILEAGSRRIRPLVMTAVTSIVSLLPVMWATSAGSEIMKPMAIPTIGGLLIEGISLFVVPVLYSFLMERRLLRGQSLGNE